MLPASLEPAKCGSQSVQSFRRECINVVLLWLPAPQSISSSTTSLPLELDLPLARLKFVPAPLCCLDLFKSALKLCGTPPNCPFQPKLLLHPARIEFRGCCAEVHLDRFHFKFSLFAYRGEAFAL